MSGVILFIILFFLVACGDKDNESLEAEDCNIALDYCLYSLYDSEFSCYSFACEGSVGIAVYECTLDDYCLE